MMADLLTTLRRLLARTPHSPVRDLVATVRKSRPATDKHEVNSVLHNGEDVFDWSYEGTVPFWRLKGVDESYAKRRAAERVADAQKRLKADLAGRGRPGPMRVKLTDNRASDSGRRKRRIASHLPSLHQWQEDAL